jgi:hypothetical protein
LALELFIPFVATLKLPIIFSSLAILLDVFGVFLGMFIGSRLSPNSLWQRYVSLYFIFLVKGSTLLSSGAVCWSILTGKK